MLVPSLVALALLGGPPGPASPGETLVARAGEPLAAPAQEPERPARRVLQSTPAAEIDATTWYGLGDAAPPTLAALRGRVVLLEFWASW